MPVPQTDGSGSGLERQPDYFVVELETRIPGIKSVEIFPEVSIAKHKLSLAGYSLKERFEVYDEGAAMAQQAAMQSIVADLGLVVKMTRWESHKVIGAI